jgi:VCBS repeat-containing protein
VTFGYTINDTAGTGADSTTNVTLVIGGVNDNPVAVDDGPYAATEDIALNVDVATGVLSNDSDPDNEFDTDGDSDIDVTNTLSAVIVSNPTNGSVALNANGSFTYTPNANFSGPDSFTYRVLDGVGGQSSAATVSIEVAAANDAPVAVNDPSYVTQEDTALSVAVAQGVRDANDSDVDTLLADVVVELVTGPTKGNLTLNADGSFEYTPNANANGLDTFTYRLRDTDNALSNTATATINITPLNDAPVANGDGPVIGTEDTPLIIAVLSNDTDVENNSLTPIITQQPPAGEGTVSVNANGTVTYTPALNFFGSTSFQYRVSDGGAALSNTATVLVTVNPVNDAPVTNPNSYNTTEDTPLTVPANGVLGNDTDAELNALTAQLVAGSLTPGSGSLTLNADGSFTFTPATNFSGNATFQYRASDGQAQNPLSAPTTVTITVAEDNDPPTANPDGPFTMIRDFVDQPVNGLLNNDSTLPDVGETLTVVAVNGATIDGSGNAGPVATTNGTVRISGGQILYTPNAGYVGPDSFDYTISDNRSGNPLTDTAIVTLDVIAFVPKKVGGVVFIDSDNNGLVFGGESYTDANSNGVYDAGEAFTDSASGPRDNNRYDAPEKRVMGVEVHLYGEDFQGNIIGTPQNPMVATTDSDGNYVFLGDASTQFQGLAPGSYTVVQVQPDYLTDGADSEASIFASKPAASNDRFELSWEVEDALDLNAHITGLNFGEGGINASSLADSRGLIQEMLASSGPNGMVLATDMSGNSIWSWSMPGWANMATCQIELDADLASATLNITDKDGGLFSIRIHQDPSQNDSGYPAGSLARFRVLGRSANNEYIIRLDGTALDFGLDLLAFGGAGEGEMPVDRSFAEAADAVFADESWA